MPTTTAPPTLADTADHADDVAAIERLIADVGAGISTRDPDRCVARFAADARSVIASGVRSVGRDAIRAAHVAVFAAAQVPATARFVLLHVLFVRPDVALATTGAYPVAADVEVDRDAPPTVVTWTLVREADGWWVAGRQFTRVAA
ncbi:SgcJ/EcaC family oxidoreductase [Iamia sp. SCSIO 61187]|uniref:SgcJ/EcaC family oxidoreductase n=1 Tax=Iamia sp. SCSIO 61187 TaxID=2722752 RepID=UPI001C625F30|nr:SgcJ/EcaC family oxidoreductase [Iamia sp. SCSIO 61187]QYG92112.1 SgcJ/EcaC family oxidoreductase [Iamia sp. SCSIO 61187]